MRNLIKAETTRIFEFIQEYVNEIAMNYIYNIKAHDKSSTEKMESIDWMVRNIEFISENISNSFLKVCHDIRKDKHSEIKNMLYESPHVSQINYTIKRLISDAIVSTGGSVNLHRQLPKYLDYLEVIQFSDYNNECLQNYDMQEVLTKQIITLYDTNKKDEIYHGAIKALSFILGKGTFVMSSCQNPDFIRWLSTCVHRYAGKPNDIEFICQILEYCFRNSSTGEMLIKASQTLPSDLIDLTNVTREGDDNVLQMNMKVLLNFSECGDLLDYQNPADKIEVLINLANESSLTKPKYMCYAILKNLSRRNQFLQVLHKNGMLEIIQDS